MNSDLVASLEGSVCNLQVNTGTLNNEERSEVNSTKMLSEVDEKTAFMQLPPTQFKMQLKTPNQKKRTRTRPQPIQNQPHLMRIDGSHIRPDQVDDKKYARSGMRPSLITPAQKYRLMNKRTENQQQPTRDVVSPLSSEGHTMEIEARIEQGKRIVRTSRLHTPRGSIQTVGVV